MKANELIVGCWVTGKKWREKPFKLTRINDSGKYYYGITAEGSQVGPFLIEELEPISLTAEILEANFEKKTFYGIYDDYFDLDIREYSDGLYIVTYHSCEFNIPDQTIHLSWVHELQHFMRLCGIEKEIEL